MESEKVKEIKKALECCVDSIKYGCEGCPYHKSSSDCQELLIWDMQTYINELESENERLLESCKNCHYIKDLEIANGHAKELKDRIALLEKENETLRNAKVIYETVDYCAEDLRKAEKRIAELEEELKNYKKNERFIKEK